MRRDRPKVSVVLPAYNAAAFLGRAISSILTQRFADFELLIIDDGSDDDTARIAESFGDSRVRVIRHEANIGLVATLNEGLECAVGEYIARMDADDISLPSRLKLQVECLDSRPDVGMCGSWARRFGGDSRLMSAPTEPEQIRCDLLFYSSFVHPSVMMRTEAFRSNGLTYRRFRHVEDFELWQRAAECFPMVNLPQVLVKYRVHGGSISGSCSNAADARFAAREIDRRALAWLGIEADDADLSLHADLRRGAQVPLEAAEMWLCRLSEANSRVNFYPREEFDRAVARRWFHCCDAAKGWGASKLSKMRRSALSAALCVSLPDMAKFLVRVR